MQFLTLAQNAGDTEVLGRPGDFLRLRNGKAAPASEDSDNLKVERPRAALEFTL